MLAHGGAKPVAKVTGDLGIRPGDQRVVPAELDGPGQAAHESCDWCSDYLERPMRRRSMYLGPCRRALTSGTSGGGGIGVVSVRLGIRQL